MDDPVIGYIDSLPEARRATALRLFDAVRAAGPELGTAIRWGKPTFGVGEDFHHWICQINATKRAVVLTFHFGGLLDDPAGRFRVGSSAYLRMLDFPDGQEVDPAEVSDFVRQAVAGLDRFKANLAER